MRNEIFSFTKIKGVKGVKMNCMEPFVNKSMSIEEVTKLLKLFGNNTDVSVFASDKRCFIQSITDSNPTPINNYTMVDLNCSYNLKYKFYLFVEQ